MMNQIKDSELKDKIEETEKKLEGVVSTHDKHWVSGEGINTVYDEQRMKLHEKIIDDYFKEYMGENAKVPEGQEPTLILLGGRGGSGKSQFDGLVYDKKNVLLIDSDKVKELIPEYKQWNASEVHQKSSVIMKKIVSKAQKSNMNVVIDQTMSSAGASLNYLNDFKGYKKEAHYMYLPPQESISRAMTRFRDDGKGGKYTGRYVPRKNLLDMTNNEKNFDEIKTKVDKWSFYSNYGVKRGDKPVLISKNW